METSLGSKGGNSTEAHDNPDCCSSGRTQRQAD